MSLLEDVFLQDEAGEAQELERIIEGDEYDERVRQESDSEENSEKEGEAEEDKRRVDPASTKAKRVVKNPRFVLNPARLTGPRGISVIPDHFKDFRFKGKGHEKEDLDLVLKKLEHWAYRLYPKFKFEDCLKKIETLGKKKVVSVHLHKIRSDQLVTEDAIVQKDSSDEEELAAPLPEVDEFDQLLQQQIDLARATPARSEISAFSTPVIDKRLPQMLPKATSSPSISDEQKERMIRNRKIAEERRLARLKAVNIVENGNTVPTVDLTNGNININESTTVINDEDNVTNLSNSSRAKKNRSNVIDSSDSDNDEIINQGVSIDAHKTVNTIDLTKLHPRQKDIINTDMDLESNNETINQADTVDTRKTLNENTVDLTEVHQRQKDIVNADVDLESNDIDYSEESSANYKEPETVIQNLIDLTNIESMNNLKWNEMVTSKTKNKRKNVIDSSDDDDDEDEDAIVSINDVSKTVKQTVIDLTEIAAQNVITTEIGSGIENKRQNMMDSSDDDDDNDVSVISEAIVVDIHKSSSQNKDTMEHNEEPITDNIDIAKETINTVKESESVVVNVENDNNMAIVKNSTQIDQNDESKVPDTTDIVNNDANEEPNSKADMNKDIDEKIDSNHDKVDEVLDDLMDVDFSDDF